MTSITGGIWDLGAGADTVTFGTGDDSTVTLANVESILGGVSNEVITLTGTITGAQIDFGASTGDTLTTTGNSTVTVTGAETITGGAGIDTITVGAGQTGPIDLGAGADKSVIRNGCATSP